MKNKILLSEILIMFLATITFVALTFFMVEINKFIFFENLQKAQVSDSFKKDILNTNQAANKPIVFLDADSTIVPFGKTANLYWTITSDSVKKCVAVSNPVDKNWYGEKSAIKGTHFQVTDIIIEDTKYIIQCVDMGGKTSLSEVNIEVLK